MQNSIQISYKDSLVGAVINAVINGAMTWSAFKTFDQVPLTLDLISTQEKSVFGQGVSLTIGLGIILSLIAWKVFSKHLAQAHPELQQAVAHHSFKSALAIALQSAFSLFGLAVTLAVVWQRLFGTVYVSPVLATCLVGVFAAVITIVIELRSKSALIANLA